MRFYLEVVGNRNDVKDVIHVCQGHYAVCTARPMTTCEHVVAIDVDNFIQKIGIIIDIIRFRRYMDEAYVRVI